MLIFFSPKRSVQCMWTPQNLPVRKKELLGEISGEFGFFATFFGQSHPPGVGEANLAVSEK